MTKALLMFIFLLLPSKVYFKTQRNVSFTDILSPLSSMAITFSNLISFFYFFRARNSTTIVDESIKI